MNKFALVEASDTSETYKNDTYTVVKMMYEVEKIK